jgi:hypothetical protein
MLSRLASIFLDENFWQAQRHAHLIAARDVGREALCSIPDTVG